MQLRLAKNMGFCFGVRRAVDMATGAAKERGRVYTLGELIHNREVFDELEKEGVYSISSIDELPYISKEMVEEFKQEAEHEINVKLEI